MRKTMAGLALALLTAGAAQAADFPLTGTWTLTVADRITPAGVQERDYGQAPKGRLIVDARGRYSLQIYKSERIGFASGDKKRGTPEEYVDAALGSSTHYGTITIDEAAHVLRFKIDGASRPGKARRKAAPIPWTATRSATACRPARTVRRRFRSGSGSGSHRRETVGVYSWGVSGRARRHEARAVGPFG
jgi:hypothetical protein